MGPGYSSRQHCLEFLRPHAARPRLERSPQANSAKSENGGEGGIRTHGTLARTPVFKTGAFNHSATSPDADAPPVPRCGRYKCLMGHSPQFFNH